MDLVESIQLGIFMFFSHFSDKLAVEDRFFTLFTIGLLAYALLH